jgi:hypothetical protein
MLIQKTSQLTGKLNSMELNVTEEQIKMFISGELVQRVFPHLSVDEREFIISGITPEEWNAVFGN